MNYYLDTEFIEKPGSIQLISIGITDEKGNDFYAVSSEFNEADANDWVKENVISKLGNVERKSLAQIKEELIKYLEFSSDIKLLTNKDGRPYFGRRGKEQDENHYIEVNKGEIVFWGYFADYDWVVFCWLFGTMMDLPQGMPMQCMDLKQEMIITEFPNNLKPKDPVDSHNALADARWNRVLHNTMIAWQMQEDEKKLHKEYEYLRDEIKIALLEFSREYNKLNPTQTIQLELTYNKTRTTVHADYIGKGSVGLLMRYKGGAHLLLNKVFGHRSEEEYAAEFDWALKLYRAAMFDLIGSAIASQIQIIDAKESLNLLKDASGDKS